MSQNITRRVVGRGTYVLFERLEQTQTDLPKGRPSRNLLQWSPEHEFVKAQEKLAKALNPPIRGEGAVRRPQNPAGITSIYVTKGPNGVEKTLIPPKPGSKFVFE